MREIKFRGKSTYDRRWFFGSLLLLENGDRRIVTMSQWIEGVIPATVGQFTGLKDSTGKEIYEGDILRVADGVFGHVRYDCDGYVVVFETGNTGLFQCLSNNLGKVDVVSNIHDSPELLEEHK